MNNTEDKPIEFTLDDGDGNQEVYKQFGTLQLPGNGETTRGEKADDKPALLILMEASHALNIIQREINKESLTKEDLSILRPKLNSLVPILSDNIEFEMKPDPINALIFACEEFEEVIFHIDSKYGRIDVDYIYGTVSRGLEFINQAIFNSMIPYEHTESETIEAYFSLVQFFKRQGKSTEQIEKALKQIDSKDQHLVPELLTEFNAPG